MLRPFETARQRDVEDSGLRVQNKLARPVEANPHAVGGRTLTECLGEQPTKLARARSRFRRKLFDAERMREAVAHQLERVRKAGVLDVRGGVHNSTL